MVPDIIIAAFRREDLVRLHTLLVCYESPFRTSDEALLFADDTAAHDRLRAHVADLLRGGKL
jgi:hypothetical protein